MGEEKDAVVLMDNCVECSKEFEEGEWYYESQGEKMCLSCRKRKLNEDLANIHASRKLYTVVLLRFSIGFLLGLLIGLDIYFGFGILCDTPIKFVLIPILLPLVTPLLTVSVKESINVIKNQWDVEREKYAGNDNSAGLLFLVFLITTGKLLFKLPFGAAYLAGDSIHKLVLLRRVRRSLLAQQSELYDALADTYVDDERA